MNGNKIGKLYRKEDIDKWYLPEETLSKLDYEKYKNFFMIFKDKDNKSSKQIDFSLFPTNNDYIYYIEVLMPKIIPLVLHDILSILKEINCQVFSSTGVCKTQDNCLFGIYLSHDTEIELSELKVKLEEIEEIEEVKVFRYGYDEYCEI